MKWILHKTLVNETQNQIKQGNHHDAREVAAFWSYFEIHVNQLEQLFGFKGDLEKGIIYLWQSIICSYFFTQIYFFLIEYIQLQRQICFVLWLRDLVLDKGKREKTSYIQK